MRKLRLMAALAALVGGALIAGVTPADASPAGVRPAPAGIAGYHELESAVNPSLCLAPEANPGTRVVLAACTGLPDQSWLPLNDGSNRYRFVSGSGRGCMSVNNVPFNGAVVQMDNCTLSDGSGRSVSNAQWQASTSLPNRVTLKTRVGNKNNNFCLDDPFQSQTPGQPMQLFACNNTLAQFWWAGFN